MVVGCGRGCCRNHSFTLFSDIHFSPAFDMYDITSDHSGLHLEEFDYVLLMEMWRPGGGGGGLVLANDSPGQEVLLSAENAFMVQSTILTPYSLTCRPPGDFILRCPPV